MKKEYLQTICNKLNECGFTTYDADPSKREPYSQETKDIKKLEWLPEENLKKIAEYDYSAAKDFSSLYSNWRNAGFFKFTPYIVDGKENGTLCVGHDRFLHMFRGYHYQLSGTPDGRGSYGTGLMRVDNFINLMSDDDYARSHLGFIVLYAAMIDCGFQSENFRLMFTEDREAVDEFFRKSLESWGVKFSYGYDVIAKYISYRYESINVEECGHPVYCLRDRHGVWCRFWSSPEAVEVEYCYDESNGFGTSRIMRFDIPNPIEGIGVNSIAWWTDEHTKDLNESFIGACYSGEKIEHFILLMMLKLVGINTNFTASYPIRDIGYIHEDMSATTIEKFDDIMAQ